MTKIAPPFANSSASCDLLFRYFIINEKSRKNINRTGIHTSKNLQFGASLFLVIFISLSFIFILVSQKCSLCVFKLNTIVLLLFAFAVMTVISIVLPVSTFSPIFLFYHHTF